MRRHRGQQRVQRQFTVATGILLLAVFVGVPTMLESGFGTAFDRTANSRLAAKVPADAPELGLVYQDLKRAAKDAPCAGAYEVLTRETCSHGPDHTPPGLTVSRAVAPVASASPPPASPRRELTSPPEDAEVALDEGAVSPDSDTPVLVPDAAPGAAAFTVGDDGVACEGDGRAGRRVQVLYVYEFGKPSRYNQYLASFRTWAAGVDAIFNASAAETGGTRHVRYVTTADCAVDVAEVQVGDGDLASLQTSIKALRALGYNRTDRKYLIFADTTVYCGIATFVADRRPGPGNRNNGGPSYGRADAGCWNASVAAHELTHTLGGVLSGAPNASKDGHCVDDFDLMCYPDDAKTKVTVRCTDRGHERRLDCNHDDYFHTDPRPGSYLAENWNVADSDFLLRDDPDDDTASAPTSAAPSKGSGAPPTPRAGTGSTTDGSTKPDPSPSGGPGTVRAAADTPDTATPARAPQTPAPRSSDADRTAPTAARSATPTRPTPSADSTEPPREPVAPQPPPLEAVLQTSETTSTATRLAWTPAAPGTRFVVTVDGRPVGTTRATRARLIGLRPGTAYRIQVLLTGDAGEHGAAVQMRTAPAAQPAPDTWFLLANSLTGGAADLYGARTAQGTPVVLNRAEGGAQQLWKLVPGSDGSFQLVSKATDKCIVPLRNNPVVGAPLVQTTCASGDVTQQWWIGRTDFGFTLRTASGDLVVGVGRQRFGGPRVLVLQKPEQARHQSWSALPE